MVGQVLQLKEFRDTVLKLIARCKLTSNARVVLHRVVGNLKANRNFLKSTPIRMWTGASGGDEPGVETQGVPRRG